MSGGERDHLVFETANVTGAWHVSRGAGAIVAVIDDSVDLETHPDFEGRLLPAYVATRGQHRVIGRRSAHGAKVAGLAAAGGDGCTGIAPEASLLPVSVPSLHLGPAQCDLEDALQWTSDKGADVVCCAWAPPNPSADSATLAAPVRDAIDHCLTHGRNGKGCVIIFSAGNDGSDLALNGYASHPDVVAVGACNCHGKHPSYSGWGDALWCVFPSNDPRDPIGARMTYLTTAPVGSLLDGEAYYTTRFGFTSAACAAVAGICALIVSANPDLTAAEVKAVLRDSCDKIDLEGGTYDANGHSPLYGYGRPDVARAVELARQRVSSAPVAHVAHEKHLGVSV